MLGSSYKGSGPTRTAKRLSLDMSTGAIILALSSVWDVVVGLNSYVSPSMTKSQVKGLQKMEAIQICKMLDDWVLQNTGCPRNENVPRILGIAKNKKMANNPSRDLNIPAPHSCPKLRIIKVILRSTIGVLLLLMHYGGFQLHHQTS